MIIRAAVTCDNFKNSRQILLNRLQFLAMPTSTITDAMAWKCFVDTIQ